MNPPWYSTFNKLLNDNGIEITETDVDFTPI